MARKQDLYTKSAQSQVLVDGQAIRLSNPKDRAEIQRVIEIIDRKVAEDDWRPFSSKEEAVKSWSELKGVRAAVLRAKGLSNRLQCPPRPIGCMSLKLQIFCT